MSKAVLILSGAALLAGMPTAAHSAAPVKKKPTTSFRLSSGVSYSSGKYGNPVATRVIAVPLSARVIRGRLSARISIPYVHLTGPGSLIDTPVGSGGGTGTGTGGGGGSVGSGGTRRNVSGFGDTNVTLAYSFDLGRQLSLDASGKFKIPTASTAKRLGTGQVDFTAQAELAKQLGKLGLYGGGRRKFAGKSSAFPVRDTWGAGAGANYRLSDTVVIGGGYDWQQSSFRSNKPISEVTAWTSVRLKPKLRLFVYAATGTNSNSIDRAFGLTITRRFD